MATLTSGERLILFMLSEIYEKLGIDGEIDPAFIKDAVTRHPWGLRWKYETFFEEETPRQVVDETADILSMWRMIDNAYKALSDEEKARVEKEAYPYSVKFEGFDGNNDKHHSVAHFLTDKLGRFDERKGTELNSHSSSSLPGYMRSLEVYRRLLSNHEVAWNGLSADQIIEILKK